MAQSGPQTTRRRTRYGEILDTLRARIFDGTYPVGRNLPSEAEFCREFDASRFTVREALRRLQQDGLVARQQGAGSTVIRAAATGAFVQSYDSITELTQFAQDTGYRVLSVTPLTLDATAASQLDGQAGAVWTCQRGLRLGGAGQAPLALIESYIPPELAALAPALAEKKPPFYAFLEQETGRLVTEVIQEVQALEMPVDVAEALNVAPGTISLRLLRRYETANGPLIASFNWHLGGNRYIYRTRLKQQTAAPE